MYNIVTNSKEFYFGRQNDYSKYRPEYPKELFEFLEKNYNLKNKTIVELGAGTGKFSKLASNYCKKIYYIEPNIDMLNEGKKYCNECNNIVFINACAEDTQVPNSSSDIVFAVQSFHWFDKVKLKEEVDETDPEVRARLYKDIAHPINSGTRDRIQKIILESYEKALDEPDEEV